MAGIVIEYARFVEAQYRRAAVHVLLEGPEKAPAPSTLAQNVGGLIDVGVSPPPDDAPSPIGAAARSIRRNGRR